MPSLTLPNLRTNGRAEVHLFSTYFTTDTVIRIAAQGGIVCNQVCFPRVYAFVISDVHLLRRSGITMFSSYAIREGIRVGTSIQRYLTGYFILADVFERRLKGEIERSWNGYKIV